MNHSFPLFFSNFIKRVSIFSTFSLTLFELLDIILMNKGWVTIKASRVFRRANKFK